MMKKYEDTMLTSMSCQVLSIDMTAIFERSNRKIQGSFIAIKNYANVKYIMLTRSTEHMCYRILKREMITFSSKGLIQG